MQIQIFEFNLFNCFYAKQGGGREDLLYEVKLWETEKNIVVYRGE